MQLDRDPAGCRAERSHGRRAHASTASSRHTGLMLQHHPASARACLERGSNFRGGEVAWRLEVRRQRSVGRRRQHRPSHRPPDRKDLVARGAKQRHGPAAGAFVVLEHDVTDAMSVKRPRGALEHLLLMALDVDLHHARSLSADHVVQFCDRHLNHAFNIRRVVFRRDVRQAVVRRRRIGKHEGGGARLGTQRSIVQLDSGHLVLPARMLDVASQPCGDVRIRLERQHAPVRPRRDGTEQRHVSQVRPDVDHEVGGTCQPEQHFRNGKVEHAGGPEASSYVLGRIGPQLDTPRHRHEPMAGWRRGNARRETPRQLMRAIDEPRLPDCSEVHAARRATAITELPNGSQPAIACSQRNHV